MTKQKMDLKNFFNGSVIGDGAIYNFFGMIIKTFHVEIKCTWKKNEGTFKEYFTFSDGKTDERTWTINFTSIKKFKGTAHDVIGVASGFQKDDHVNLKYKLAVPYNESTIVLCMDDWMHLIAKDVILNRTSMKKFGIKVGELIIFLRKK